MSVKSSIPAIESAVEPTPPRDALLHPDAIRAFERCPLAIMQLTVRQEVVYANQAALALSGWSSCAGHTIRDLIGDDATFQQFQHTFQDRLRGTAAEYELDLTRNDGRRIPVSVAATPITDAQGIVTGSIGVLRSLLRERAVEALDNRIKGGQSAHQIFEAITQEVAKLVPFELCVISLYTDDLRQARMVFSHWASGHASWPARYFDIPAEMKKFLERRVPEPINDLKQFRNDPRWKLVHDPKLEEVMHNLESSFRIPLVRQDRVVGSITFFRNEVNGFDKQEKKEDVDILMALSLDKATLSALTFMEEEERRLRDCLIKELASHEGVDLLDKAISSLIVQRLAEHYDWEVFTILRVNLAEQRFELQSQVVRVGTKLPEDYTQPIKKGVLGRAYREGNDQRSSDVLNDPLFRPIYIQAGDRQICSEMCLPIRVDGEIVGMLNIEDSRRNAFSEAEEQAVRSLLDQASALIEHRKTENIIKVSFEWTPSAVFIVSEAGIISKANPSALDMLGYTEQELKGKPMLEVLEPEEHTSSLLRVSCAFRDDINVVRKDGRRSKVSVASSRLGEGIGTIVSARDLASRKRIEELEYMERIFYDIAAQTKIPLALTFSWLSKLKQQFESGTAPHSKQAADTLSKATDQLRKAEITYDHMVLYDKEIAGGIRSNPVVLQIGRLLQQLSQEFPEAERRRIAVSGNALDSYILGDTYQISFVLLAILSYGLRFMPENKNVRVTVESRTRAQGEWVEIAIGAMAPVPPERARREMDAFVMKVISDINLGTRIIQLFVAANDGVYMAPKDLTGPTRFKIRFPVTAPAG